MSNFLEGAGGGGGGGRQATRTKDTLFSQDFVEIIFGVAEGPIGGLKSGVHGPLENFFIGETPLQSPATGESNFKEFKIVQRRGRDDDPEIVRVLGGDTSNLAVGVTLAQSVAVTRTTPSNLRKTVEGTGITRLEVRLLFNQLFRTDDKGDYEHTARFRIEYKASNSATWIRYKGEAESTVFGKTTSGAVKDFLIDVPALTDADYDIRLTKLSPDAETTEFVEITWESVQMVTLGNNQFPGLASLHAYARVTDQFSSLPEMSGVFNGLEIDVPTNYNSVTRVYDDAIIPWFGTFKKAFTSNPAWILYYLLMSTEHGLAHYFKNVATNRYEFYAAAKWCDEQVPSGVDGVTQPRFTFNELIDSRRLGLETLHYIAGSFNSTIYDAADGSIRLRTDQYRTPKQIFTPENLLKDGRFTYSMTDIATRFNDVTVRFVNPDLGWKEDQRKASIDATAWQEKNGIIPLDFFAVGCTNVHEAIRRANDRLLTANREITTVSFVTNRFGVTTEPYDIVFIADPSSGWSSGGRIKSIGDGLVQLRDPIYFQAITSAVMKIQTYSGIVELTVTPNVIGLNYTLNVVAGTIPTNIPDRTVFTLEDNPNFGFCKPFRVVTIAEVRGNSEAFRLTCLEVNPAKYVDSANGTVSEPIQYDTSNIGEPKLPTSMLVENMPPLITSDGSITYRLKVSWKRPPQANTKYYEIDFMLEGTGDWTTVRTYNDDAILQPLQDGETYVIRLFAINPLGVRSDRYLESINEYVATKTGTLPNVQNLDVALSTLSWVASWDAPTAIPDWDGVALKITAVGSAWGASQVDFKSKTLSQPLPWLTAGINRIQAKHIDTSGNESAAPTVFDLTVDAPAAITIDYEFFSAGTLQLDFSDATTDQPLKRIHFKIGTQTQVWNDIVDATSLGADARTASIVFETSGNKRVMLRAEDLGGNLGPVTNYDLILNLRDNLLDIIGDLPEAEVALGSVTRDHLFLDLGAVIDLIDAEGTGLVTKIADLEEVYGDTVSSASNAAAAAASAIAADIDRIAAEAAGTAAATAQTAAEFAQDLAEGASWSAGIAQIAAEAATDAGELAQAAAESAEAGAIIAQTSAISANNLAQLAATAAAASSTASTAAQAASEDASDSAVQAKLDAIAAKNLAQLSEAAAAASSTASTAAQAASETAQGLAESASASSNAAKADAITAKVAAELAAIQASGSGQYSAEHSSISVGAANTAVIASDDAVAAAISAEGSSAAALSSKIISVSSANTAGNFSGTASIKATEAAMSASDASGSASSAATSRDIATSAADSATGSATTAGVRATEAATSATNAAGSASSASTSQSLAATSATNAGASASAAGVSASQAATSESNAAGSASTAATSSGLSATSANNAATSAGAASVSAGAAATSATNASGSASGAATSAGLAATSQSDASASAATATTKATEAAASASTAEGSASQALSSKELAVQAASDATEQAATANIAAEDAVSAAISAAASSSEATFSKTISVSSANAAGTSASEASIKATQAASSASDASGSASSASTSATLATSAASAASASETAASISASNSATSASNASGSASTASTQAGIATSAANAAGTSATNASTSASQAATSETNAAGSASSASTSSGTAAGSASAASASAGAASTSASQASTSASNASGSASAAGTSAGLAATSASNASASAGAASISATESAASASTAEGSASLASASKALSVQAASTATEQASTASIAAEDAVQAAISADASASSASSSKTIAVSSSNAAGTFAGEASIKANQSAASASDAAGSASSASTSQTIATSAANAASASQTAASISESNAATSATNASGSASTATTQAGIATSAANAAGTSATNAGTSATNAANSETNAAGSASSAATSSGTAAASATTAGNAATAAGVSAGAASTSAGAASTSATNAAGSASAAGTSATNAASSSSAASSSAGTATTKAAEAAASASTAQGSASTAEASKVLAVEAASTATDMAATAEIAAEDAVSAAISASASSSEASSSKTIAVSSSNAAGTFASEASIKATQAAISASNAEGSVAAAATQVTLATTAANNAGTSATNASTSAGAAATSASNASGSASGAATSASNSASSASSASSSAGTATTKAAEAAASASDALGSASQASSSREIAVQAASTATQQAANASIAADDAVSAAISASSSASEATSSKTISVSSANAAGTSAGEASVKATQAASSASDAAGSASSASTSATVAAASQSAAAGSATAAGTSATNAATSATAAGTSATSASNSANTATTQAGNASTSAGSAATSATTASGSASTAGTHATNAANSASAAGGSASAAAGSASSAATSSTAAGNSATSANASRVSAQSNAQTKGLSPNGEITNGLDSWYYDTNLNPLSGIPAGYEWLASYQDRAGIIKVTGDRTIVGAKVPVDPTRKYKIRTSVYVDTGVAAFYAGLVAFDAAGNQLAHNPGSYAYSTIFGNSVAAGSWSDWPGNVVTGEGTGTFVIFPVGTRYAAPLMLANYGASTSGAVYVDKLFIEDVSESENALASSSASATSASTAATSATAAGNSATAANASRVSAESARDAALGSATAASGSASSASTSATAAGTSATSASASATSASTQAGNALTYAGQAATSATNADGSSTQAANYLTQVRAEVVSAFAAFQTWDFNNEHAGWATFNATGTDQANEFLLTPTGADWSLYTTALTAFAGALYDKVRARIRKVSGTTTWDGLLFYGTASHSYDSNYYKAAPLPTNLASGAWCVVEWDMSALSAGGADWKNSSITGLRIDLDAGTSAVYEVDWVAVGRIAPPVSAAQFVALQTTVANNNTATTTSITNLSATVGANTTAIATEATSRATADGALFSQYTVKIESNGYISGFGLASSANNATPISSFIVRADSFSVGNPAGPGLTPVVPFTVKTSDYTNEDGTTTYAGVYMNGANIVDLKAGRITTGYLSVNRLAANSITVDKLTVGARGGAGLSMIKNSDFTEFSGVNGGIAAFPRWADANSGSVTGASYERNFAQGSVWNLGPGGATLFDTHAGGTTEWGFVQTIPVVQGVPYEFHAKGSVHRCYARFIGYWKDAANAVIGAPFAISSPNPGVEVFGEPYQLVQLLWGTATAPTGAVNLELYVTKYPTATGQANSYAFFHELYMAPAVSGASASNPSPYRTPGVTEIHGGGIKTGTVTANKLSVTSLDAVSATVGLLRTASSGARTEIASNVIRVYDSSNVLRVKLGDLS